MQFKTNFLGKSLFQDALNGNVIWMMQLCYLQNKVVCTFNFFFQKMHCLNNNCVQIKQIDSPLCKFNNFLIRFANKVSLPLKSLIGFHTCLASASLKHQVVQIVHWPQVPLKLESQDFSWPLPVINFALVTFDQSCFSWDSKCTRNNILSGPYECKSASVI